eukprot:TRINITY_DN1662_c0_g1_i2.p1 TRINITY_DN1662_c0_g1~~TRINITY_DN1662_c0_g1_i2.p1  ORF type:complete len:444 (+),score=145.44 TRINITY_DN1662_c0_g1_i2:79-1332(+)
MGQNGEVAVDVGGGGGNAEDKRGSGSASAASAVACPPADPQKPPVPLLHGFPFRRRVYPANAWKLAPRRKHGFHRPWHLLQVLSWLLFLFFFLVLLLILAPALPLTWEYVTYAVVGVGYVIMIGSNYKAAITDPGDPGIDQPNVNIYRDDGVPTAKCGVCDAFIRYESKHCKSCNKCIADFDHHCKWLNSCVGAKNYPYFYTFLTGTLAMMSYLLALCIYLFQESYAGEDRLARRLDERLNGMPMTNFRAAVGVIFFLGFVTEGLLLQLTHFHWQLHDRRQTTYEWILYDRKAMTRRNVLSALRAMTAEAAVEAADDAEDGAQEMDAMQRSGYSTATTDTTATRSTAATDDLNRSLNSQPPPPPLEDAAPPPEAPMEEPPAAGQPPTPPADPPPVAVASPSSDALSLVRLSSSESSA